MTEWICPNCGCDNAYELYSFYFDGDIINDICEDCGEGFNILINFNINLTVLSDEEE